MQSTVLGVAIMLVATSMTNLGAVLQKKAVDRLPPFDAQPLWDSVRAVLRSPLWLVGWLLSSSAIVLNMLALGLADISLIQPLNGFGLVVLAVASRLLLGERLSGLPLAGIGAVIAGVVLVGVTAPPSRVFTAPEELVACYLTPQALAAQAALLLGILALWLAAARLGRASGILYAVVGASCSVAGLTFAKGFFGILTLEGVAPTFARAPAYPLLALLLFFAIAAMMFQQLSFQKGRAVVVTPVFAATSVLLPLVTGRFVFAERLAATSWLAVACILAGVVLLGLRPRAAASALPQGVS